MTPRKNAPTWPLLWSSVERLDEKLLPLRERWSDSLAPNGWIRLMRRALGMSGRQLAERLGVSRQSVSRLERAETEGAVTIQMMRRAADAMDCEFVYMVLPRRPLTEIVEKQAERAAQRIVMKTSQTMELEDQGLPVKKLVDLRREKADQLAEERPRWMWNLSPEETKFSSNDRSPRAGDTEEE